MIQTRRSDILAIAFLSVITTASAANSQETELSNDFKNGSVFGQAIQARATGYLCLNLLQEMAEDGGKPPDPFDPLAPQQKLWAHLFQSVAIVHDAVELPDSALPGNSKELFEKWLMEVSDHLHKTVPDMMDPSKYKEGRRTFAEEFRDHHMRDTFLAIYDRQTKTVTMLAKYRSATKKRDKTNEE